MREKLKEIKVLWLINKDLISLYAFAFIGMILFWWLYIME